MGWQVARYSYWLLIVVGSLLLFGREQEFHLLKIVVCVGLPVALIWVCCSFFRLMLKGAASTFARAQRALSKVAMRGSRQGPLPDVLETARRLMRPFSFAH
jgi:hypothetical protein